MVNLKQKFSSASSEDWVKRLDRVAPVVLLLLILILCWKLASLFWWVIAPPQVMQTEQVSVGSQQAQVPNISAFSLFQETGSTAEAADANLVMQLQGVIVGSSNRFSSAVIKVNEVADRYGVGQMIEGSSYQLSEVYWDYVVLRQSNGATKELKFTRIDNLYQPLGPESAAQQPMLSTTPAQAPANNQQNVLGQAIDKIQENRDQYLKNLGVSTSGGEGYQVTDQTPAALRNKLGLKSGDRILSLNGQAVGQGQTDVQLLEQVKKEGKVKIEVKRGDQVMTFQQDL